SPYPSDSISMRSMKPPLGDLSPSSASLFLRFSIKASFWGLILPIATLVASSALAQQPVQPLPKVGSCPLDYYSSGSYSASIYRGFFIQLGAQS
ncbi:MAG: hypothetical protein NTW02_14295, partial [Cyanobium sp. LacPavin_0920_WC12_MAG_62_9]|nr:hypothetical protein [Cyanobium sp. LacPavin_0920_WC12_MAG_62_9]